MPVAWEVDKLKALPVQTIQSLYRRARDRGDTEGRRLADMILDNDLLVEAKGGLPFDHPIMIEIAEICATREAVAEAVAASDAGLPALAGMEHRIVAALGDRYGGNYTTNHAGRCIADEMTAKGWIKTVQRPMPGGSIAKSATVFVRKERN